MVFSPTGFAAPTRMTVGTTEGIGRANAATILSTVLVEGPLARSEIAERVGLTRATVTRVSNRLLEIGLLKEGAPRRENLGRPLIPLALAGEDRVAISVHFGALESRVGMVDLHGRVLSEERDRYHDHDPVTLVRVVAGRVNDLVRQHGARQRILGIGASIGGWIEPESGEVIRFEPLGWERVPLADLLVAETGLPLHFDQIVRGLALAERMYGAARGMSDFLEFWVGNVVGAALVHRGEVRRGPRGASGIITHFPVRNGSAEVCECGRTGCLVHAINDDAVLAEARRRSLVGPDADIREIIQIAKGGDAEMRELIATVAGIAGEAAAAMADFVNPSALVVAGLLTTAPGYLDAFKATLAKSAEMGDLLEVRASAFGDLAPTIASASVILDHYFSDPLGYERISL